MSKPDFAAMRQAMIDSQLRPSGVNEPSVTAAMMSLAREKFVPDDRAAICYMDRSIPLGDGRVMNPPVTTGQMLEASETSQDDKALLIGGASGYIAALLAPRVGNLTILEESDALSKQAAKNIDAAANIEHVSGPLNAGHKGSAPYTLIWIEGAIEQLPEQITAQLADGGRIITGLSDGPVSRIAQGIKRGGELALRGFADADIAALPGFTKEKVFAF